LSNRTSQVPGIGQPAGPEFFVPPETLDAISPPGDRGGTILGSTAQNDPLTVSLLRPQPTRFITVGGLYLARQIAVRAMATGAWVIVATGRPTAWKVLETAAGQTPDGKQVPLAQIRRISPFDLPRATEDAPLLVIHDGGAVPQELFPPRAPWQTLMYVLPYLHPQVGNGPVTASADLVLLQRLPLNQAQLAQRLWSLQPQQTQELTALPDDGVIALGNMAWTRVRLFTKDREQEILGPVRRGD
jgi:hypothetical protein